MWLWHLYAMLTLYADIPRDGLTVSLWIYILSLLCLFVEYKRDVTWHLFATESTLYATFTQGVKTVGTLWSLWMRPHQSLTVWVPFDIICRIHHCTQALQREILFWHFNTTCIQRKYSLMKCLPSVFWWIGVSHKELFRCILTSHSLWMRKRFVNCMNYNTTRLQAFIFWLIGILFGISSC